MFNNYMINKVSKVDQGFNYKIWYQPYPNNSIVQPRTEIFYYRLTDSQVRGLKIGLHLFTLGDPLSNMRYQIQMIPFNAPDPSISLSLFDVQTSVIPGVFNTIEVVSPLSSMVPAEYRKYPYQYYVLLTPSPLDLNRYIIVLRDMDEFDGILRALQIIGIKSNNVIMSLQDLYGNEI